MPPNLSRSRRETFIVPMMDSLPSLVLRLSDGRTCGGRSTRTRRAALPPCASTGNHASTMREKRFKCINPSINRCLNRRYASNARHLGSGKGVLDELLGEGDKAAGCSTGPQAPSRTGSRSKAARSKAGGRQPASRAPGERPSRRAAAEAPAARCADRVAFIQLRFALGAADFRFWQLRPALPAVHARVAHGRPFPFPSKATSSDRACVGHVSTQCAGRQRRHTLAENRGTASAPEAEAPAAGAEPACSAGVAAETATAGASGTFGAGRDASAAGQVTAASVRASRVVSTRRQRADEPAGMPFHCLQATTHAPQPMQRAASKEYPRRSCREGAAAVAQPAFAPAAPTCAAAAPASTPTSSSFRSPRSPFAPAASLRPRDPRPRSRPRLRPRRPSSFVSAPHAHERLFRHGGMKRVEPCGIAVVQDGALAAAVQAAVTVKPQVVARLPPAPPRHEHAGGNGRRRFGHQLQPSRAATRCAPSRRRPPRAPPPCPDASEPTDTADAHAGRARSRIAVVAPTAGMHVRKDQRVRIQQRGSFGNSLGRARVFGKRPQNPRLVRVRPALQKRVRALHLFCGSSANSSW